VSRASRRKHLDFLPLESKSVLKPGLPNQLHKCCDILFGDIHEERVIGIRKVVGQQAGGVLVVGVVHELDLGVMHEHTHYNCERKGRKRATLTYPEVL
jgi:hypothetical protein